MNRSTKRRSNKYTEHHSAKDLSSNALNNKTVAYVSSILLALIAFFLCIAMIGFFFSGGIDQSLVDSSLRKIILNPNIIASNPAGKLGAWISDLLINHCFGLSSFIICYILLLCSWQISVSPIKNFKRRLYISIVLMLWISLFLGFITESISFMMDWGSGYLFPGGGHGYFVSTWFNALIGRAGTILLLIFSFVLILLFGFKTTFYKCVDFIKEYIRARREKAEEKRKQKEAQRQAEQLAAERRREEAQEEQRLAEEAQQQELEKEEKETIEEYQETEDLQYEEHEEDDIASPQFEQKEQEEKEEEKEKDSDFIIDTPNSTDCTEPTFCVNSQIEEEVVKENCPTEDYDPTLELSHYKYPPLELLEEHADGDTVIPQDEIDEELARNKDKIVATLRDYSIEITSIKATHGPTVTLYEIIPAPGIKISKIRNLEDDIALSLAALGIRIIAPIPGAGTVGIEVPNRYPKTVSMRGLIASKKFQESGYALPVALGRTIANETFTFDLTKMPHLLVAGATGQGKSVGLNAIITSLLYKKHPSQLKFVMVDPKKVELSIYSVIEKHFLAKIPDSEEAIITDTTKVINTLNSLCIEMDSRYDLLKEAHVRNIKEYNKKFIKRMLNPEKGHRYLPYIVVVVDEFSDLIMTAGKEVETPIARIAQLARAVGIHMIIATQRPSTNVITGLIKANFPARIAFKVASMIDSRTILDSPGANQLIGRGDLLISVNSEMTRVQCAFVDTPEVDEITRFIAEQQSYPSAYELPEYVPETESSNGVSEIDLGQRDPLFEEAARLLVSTQQGSTSSIQRRFSIGYNRAGRIMDQLEAKGIVGPFEGSKARQVLVQDEYTLEQLLNK